jgi:hypothetical protein
MMLLLVDHGAGARFYFGFHPRQEDIEEYMKTYCIPFAHRLKEAAPMSPGYLRWKEVSECPQVSEIPITWRITCLNTDSA